MLLADGVMGRAFPVNEGRRGGGTAPALRLRPMLHYSAPYEVQLLEDDCATVCGNSRFKGEFTIILEAVCM